MKENYDFSKAVRNPYLTKIKKEVKNTATSDKSEKRQPNIKQKTL